MSRKNTRKVKSGSPAKAKKSEPPRRRASPALLALGLVLVLAVAGAIYSWQRPRASGEATRAVDTVTIDTSRGQVVMEIYPSKMPATVKNFEDLANKGFYANLLWHRVEEWVVQTGDPMGTGSGGSGKAIKLEVNPELKNLRGSVGMARSAARDSASSQFYVLKTDAPWLDGDYAVFGVVVLGMDAIDQIQVGDKMLAVAVKQGPSGAPGANPK